jgi:ATP-binding protein involved in chromosome partitioning
MAHSSAMPSPVALPGVSKIVAIGSGKGGVGKTTVAVNLAIALSKLGQRVGLIDADIYGPNVPLMMGSSQQPRVGEGNMIQPNDTHGIKTISIGYISPGDKPLVMRGPMLHQIIRQFLQQVSWGELDYLIVDLPPGTGDVVISLVQTVPLTGAVVVSTPSDVSLEDARKALEMFAQVNVEVLGMVENMSGRRDSSMFPSWDPLSWCPPFARAATAGCRWRWRGRRVRRRRSSTRWRRS